MRTSAGKLGWIQVLKGFIWLAEDHGVSPTGTRELLKSVQMGVRSDGYSPQDQSCTSTDDVWCGVRLEAGKPGRRLQ